MPTTARKPASIVLKLNFSNPVSTRKSIQAYAAEIQAGAAREGLTDQQIADRAGCSWFTVFRHRNSGKAGKHLKISPVKNPQIRTVFGILFALGWKTIEIQKANVSHIRKVNGRRKRKAG